MGSFLSYQVGGLDFCINTGEYPLLQDELDNFSPFLLNSPNASPAFTLKVVPRITIPPEHIVLVDSDDVLFRIYQVRGGFIKDVLDANSRLVIFRLFVNEGYDKAEVCFPRPEKGLLGHAIMSAYGYSGLVNGILYIHASSVIKGGKAVLFHAKSGTGKSTHSQQWMKVFPDTVLLNDDGPVVRVWPDGRVIAYGSPWSGQTPCYKNLSAPVAAFVRINRADENKIHRLSPVQAYASLLPSCTGVKWHDDLRNDTHQTMQKVISAIPFYQLDCLPNEDAAKVCAAEVLKKR